jgi:prepilin-type N-terminal cleavage/methylation domain-containing protein
MRKHLKASQSRENQGLTLIELLVAMAVSAVLIAAIYRTFIGQYKTYGVQEQVVDMQQNARVAINRMIREIRMAGFGNVSSVLPMVTIGGTFNNIINPGNDKDNIKGQHDDQITVIGAFERISTLASEATPGTNTIQLKAKASEFDLVNGKYICIGGLETHTISSRDTATNTITLNENILNRFPVDPLDPLVPLVPVFKVKAIRYRLRWDNNNPNIPVLTREDLTDGGGSQVVAENIENLQFRYVLEDNSESDSPAEADHPKIRLVNVKVDARTRIPDIEIRKEGRLLKEEYRRRTISSNILVRNMGANP